MVSSWRSVYFILEVPDYMPHVTDLAGTHFFSMRLRSWSNVPCEVHALMQYTDDQSVLSHFPIEYDVGLISVPSEL